MSLKEGNEMKRILVAITLAAVLMLAACSGSSSALASAGSTNWPAFTVCVDDQASTGYDSEFVSLILMYDWNAEVTVDCAAPDVFVTIVNPGYNLGYWVADGWIYEVGGPIWLNSQVLDYAPNTFRAVLDHEVGHHFGLQHVHTRSVMSDQGRYMPTEQDIAQFADAFYAPRIGR